MNDMHDGSQTIIAPKRKKGWRFAVIMLALCLTVFLSALELTAVATALPTIVADLKGDDFVWVGSGYAMASSAILPMTGGIAQIFGRKPAVLASIFLFAVGSAICGAAQSMTMLIGGRVIQGIGGGAILSFSAIVLADLVTLEERGLYAGLFGLTWSVAAALGPVVGGALSNVPGQWRWLFYLNLPLCGISAVMAFVTLNLPTPPGTLRHKLSKMDWIGNVIAISSACAITLGLTLGGVNFPWQSPRVLAPLILGVIGFFVFIAYEATYAKNPLVPIHILDNRTSLSGYLQAFILPITTLAAIYYIPVYFQAVKDTTPLAAGVHMLGLASIALSAVIGGTSVKILQRYRPQIWLGWILMIIGMALFTTIKLQSPSGSAIGFSVVYGIGAGINYATSIYPVQAPLPVQANAHALSFHSFLRSFAGVWGVTLGGAILQNELQRRLPQEFLDKFPQGVAIVYSVIPSISHLQEPVKSQVRQAFIDSINRIYIALTAISAAGLICSLFMKGLPLNTLTDEEWAPKDDNTRYDVEKELGSSDVISQPLT
ncbi:hypothetical protein M422DRAFT_225924 [Sphaerobolus stellatus SS14]|nr:hypothetical protein M422DRAFT_225924 [Sphaerobolus stellatus SS14]